MLKYFNDLIFFFLAAGILLLTSDLSAQPEEYNHPELKWRTIETPHFFVHFHNGTERTGEEVARIAESIYPDVTRLYQYEPKEKYNFIIRDTDDYSNGGAYYYDNKIEIWAENLDFELRGTHGWLKNVVTHEFTHMISLQSSFKFGRKIPAGYLQVIRYEKEKRPDVIYGFPNLLASVPIPGMIVPAWFAEGVAQYQTRDLNYESWDSHRDMILRDRTLNQKVLSLPSMSIFGKESIGNESVYNQGYSLVRFITQRYGDDKLMKLCQAIASPFAITFESTIKKVLGISAEDLYQSWYQALVEEYSEKTGLIQKNLKKGTDLFTNGSGNFFPGYSSDGNWIAYLSNEGRDFISSTSLYILTSETGKTRKVIPGVLTSFSFSPDGEKIVYAKQDRNNRQGSHFYDLYIYDFRTGKEKRITKDARLKNPDWSSRDKIVGVVSKDGTNNLAIVNPDGSDLRIITNFEAGRQIYHPRWMPDGQKIVFDTFLEGSRDLAVLNANGEEFQFILDGYDDTRDPTPSPDGKSITYSSDLTGIFNIYNLNLETRDVQPLTNVSGGAFSPAVNLSGQLVYSLYENVKFQIVKIEKPEFIPPNVMVYPQRQSRISDTRHPQPDSLYNEPLHAITQSGKQVGRNGQLPDESLPKAYPSKSYQQIIPGTSVFPRLMFDYGTIKPGILIYSSDVLNKFSMMAAGSVNTRLDIDAFLQFEYRQLRPTLFFELYWLTRNVKDQFYVQEKINGYFNPDTVTGDIRFNLLEADLGTRLKLTDAHEIELKGVLSSYSTRINPFNFRYTYFIGQSISAQWKWHALKRMIDSEMNPRKGRDVAVTIDVESDKFLKDFATDRAIDIEIFDRYHFRRYQVDWTEHLPVPLTERHSLSVRLWGGTIDQPIHSFFNFFGGGLIGMKGYPYYSIEGRTIAISTITYRFPLWNGPAQKIGFLFFNRLYGSLFFDYGNAWDGKVDFAAYRVSRHSFKSDAGVQLRLENYSFYVYPTAIQVDAAYGFDPVTIARDINGDGNLDPNEIFKYGKEWRFYFTVLFNFPY